MTGPVASCTPTGYKISDHLATSVCDAGSGAGEGLAGSNETGAAGLAGTCADNKPWQVNDLAFGFASMAAGGIPGLCGDANCGQCYELKFTDQRHVNATSGGNWGGAHPSVVGMSMIVQVINVAHDISGEHSFDILIPSAGQRSSQTGCSRQFNNVNVDDFDCGNRYGGCSSKTGCEKLPTALRAGCEWRFNFFKWLQADGQTADPYVQFRRVKCPTQLTDISKSVPLDDAAYPAIDPNGGGPNVDVHVPVAR